MEMLKAVKRGFVDYAMGVCFEQLLFNLIYEFVMLRIFVHMLIL